MSGWIKIHRKIQRHWIWNDAEYFKSWMDLLMMANHEPRKWNTKTKIIIIKRGEVITSMRKLAKRWKWSVGKVRRFISLLRSDQMVAQIPAHSWTHLSICNYDTYQDVRHTGGHKNGTETEQKRYTTKELKELKELKRESKSVQLKNIKDSFSELKKKFPDADVESEYDKFTDWMDSKGKQYKDYKAGFRNWLRRANAFQRRSDGGNKVEFAKTPSGLWKAYCSKCNTKLLYKKPPYPNTTSECCGKDIYNYDPARVSA